MPEIVPKLSVKKKKKKKEAKKGWASEGNRRSIIKLVIYFAGHVRTVDFLLTIPRFCELCWERLEVKGH